MFHSLFNVLAFGNYPNTFGVALQRLKFPANERAGYRPDSEWLRCTRRGVPTLVIAVMANR